MFTTIHTCLEIGSNLKHCMNYSEYIFNSFYLKEIFILLEFCQFLLDGVHLQSL